MAADRKNFGKLMREIAAEEGLGLTAFSGDWGFRLEKDGKTVYTVGYQFPLNSASSKELCQDKALTYLVLKDRGVPAVEHLFYPWQTEVPGISRGEAYDAALRLLESGREVVVKNNRGTGGREVYRAATRDELDAAIEAVLNAHESVALSPFQEIREEYRVVMLDGEPLLVLRKERESVTGPSGEKTYLNWKHNLGQGAKGVAVDDRRLLQKLVPLAKAAANALAIRFASVDIAETAEGIFVLEVNAGVMLEHFSGQDETCFALAKEVYKAAVRAAFEKPAETPARRRKR